MKIGTTDTANTTDRAKPMSLDAALAVHNAKHPESRLTDITAKLEAACGRRLIGLLHQRFPRKKPTIDEFGHLLEEGDADCYRLLCYCAGFLLVRGTFHGIEWEDVKRVLQTGKGKRDAVLMTRRAARAARLLDRLLITGCLKRGEV